MHGNDELILISLYCCGQSLSLEQLPMARATGKRGA
jgi:hypothetical protein